jgi:hypothetical protein
MLVLEAAIAVPIACAIGKMLSVFLLFLERSVPSHNAKKNRRQPVAFPIVSWASPALLELSIFKSSSLD